jgi:hypothetical protein
MVHRFLKLNLNIILVDYYNHNLYLNMLVLFFYNKNQNPVLLLFCYYSNVKYQFKMYSQKRTNRKLFYILENIKMWI